ncbi:MAG: tetratricopeptide repeat protein, partial [Bacteroidetes bacterium]
MNTNSLRTGFLAVCSLLFTLPVFPGNGAPRGEVLSNDPDSMECLMNISVYREFYKIDLYKDAIDPWRQVFNECPSSSERMYVEGANMYKKFIEEAPEGPEKQALIDTLMMIYDRRVQYFGGEGNVLGRKARDLLAYRNNDIDQVHQGYQMLKRSIELDQKETSDAVLILFISASISLNKAGKIDDGQAIGDYFTVTSLLDQMSGNSSRWDKARATIDENALKSGILTCESLNNYYEPIFDQNRADKTFLEKVIAFYSSTGCDRADLYVQASEKLYEIEPGPESAHNLAILFIAKNDFQKAAGYLKEAVRGENVEPGKKAEWHYELAVVSNANGNYCEAIGSAREAIGLKG